MSDRLGRPGWLLFGSVFLVSFAVLAFEVALTRVFSVLFRYHFVFLAVSGAVCGLGLGGFGWHLLRGSRRIRPPGAGWAVLGFAVLMPASIIVLFGAANLLAASPWLSLLILLPFGCAGAFLAEIFRQHASDSGWLYHADLAGAAMAAVAVIPLIGVSGGLHLVFFLGALAAAAAVLYAAALGRGSLLVVSICCAAFLLASWPASVRAGALQLRPLRAHARSVEKDMMRDLGDAKRALLVDTEWTAYARTDLVRYQLPEAEDYDWQIYTDGDTPSTMVPFGGDLRQVRFLRADLPFVAFGLSPHRTLLSIGPGGGLDLLWAKLAGFEEIQGVEINGSVPRLMDRYRRINGDLYHRPGIHVAVEDGRSFVRRSRARFDLISSSLTQTATATGLGTSLVESYIHTQQAFADYYDHLTADGRYALVAQRKPLLLRAAFTAIAVMQDRGMEAEEACRHLVALAAPNPEHLPSPYRYLLIWKKSPFGPEDLEQITRGLRSGDTQAIFIPGLSGDSVLDQVSTGQKTLAQAADAGVLEDSLRLDIRPATDDRPFFLDLSRSPRGDLVGFLLVAFGVAAAYSIAMVVYQGGAAPGAAGWLPYFAALGIGFMLAEIPLIQKLILFLGHPTLSLAAVLFYLLSGASLGSRLSQKWNLVHLARRAAAACFAVSVILAAYALGLTAILSVLHPLPVGARLVLLGLFALPLGVVLGIPFPSGLRLMSPERQSAIPWMWGVNGMMSVAGSAAAVVLAKSIGFNACLLSAALLYAAVGVGLQRRRRGDVQRL